MQVVPSRPIGLTLLAILAAIVGLAGVTVGLFMAISGIFFSSTSGWGDLVAVIGLMFLALGAFELVLAYGVWKLRCGAGCSA